MSRFRTPAIAILLAIIPYFLFVGAANTTTINGEVVSDSRFNLAGLVMALVGLALVFGIFRPSARKDGLQKGLGALAGLLCLVQIANAVDIVRIEPLDWVFPDRDLPALKYAGLAEDDRILLSSYGRDTYIWALRGRKADIIGEARQHAAYADLCHGGRYRIDLSRAEQLPDYFAEDDLVEINQRAEALAKLAPTACTTASSNRMMGKVPDDVNRDMDMTDRLEADYLEAYP